MNVGTGGTWTLTLSFTVTEDVTIDSIALNLFTFNGSNQIQNSNRKGAYMFNLKLGDTVLASCADSSLTYAGTGDVTLPVHRRPAWRRWGNGAVLPE